MPLSLAYFLLASCGCSLAILEAVDRNIAAAVYFAKGKSDNWIKCRNACNLWSQNGVLASFEPGNWNFVAGSLYSQIRKSRHSQ
jgi:hypothetical protein